jgi:hypothetical protein
VQGDAARQRGGRAGGAQVAETVPLKRRGFARPAGQFAAPISRAALGRSLQQPREVVVGEDGALALHHGVQRLRDANAEALHPPGKRLVAVCLDDQVDAVDVVALDGELHEAHAEAAAGCRERIAQPAPRAAAAEVPDFVSHAKRDVHRHRLAETRARLVRDQPARAFRLAAGAITTSAAMGQTEFELFCAPHDWGQIAPVRGRSGIGQLTEPEDSSQQIGRGIRPSWNAWRDATGRRFDSGETIERGACG